MKLLLKTLLGLVVLVLVLVVCVVGLGVWSFPKFGPKMVDWWVESRTGFSANVGSISLKLLDGKLRVEGVALVNPPNYQNKNFMQVREAMVDWEVGSFFRERAVFKEVVIDIDRVTWVKNGQGGVNVMEFFDKLTKKKGGAVKVEGGGGVTGVKARRRWGNFGSEYIIRRLVVRVGELDMVGFVSENDVQKFVLNYSKEFTDVTDVESVMNQLIEDFSVSGALNLAQSLLGLPWGPGVLGSKVTNEVQKGIEKAFRLLQNATK